VLLGNFFYFACIIFPVLAFWVLHQKSTGYVHMLNRDKLTFNWYYECLYDGFRHQKSGLLHYYSVYLIRRILFVLLCFIFYEEQYTLFQIMGAIVLDLSFVCYLIEFKPFQD